MALAALDNTATLGGDDTRFIDVHRMIENQFRILGSCVELKARMIVEKVAGCVECRIGRRVGMTVAA